MAHLMLYRLGTDVQGGGGVAVGQSIEEAERKHLAASLRQIGHGGRQRVA